MKTTLLLLSRGLLVRAEFEGGLRVGFRRSTPDGAVGFGAMIAAATGAGELLRGPVWILSDEVYAQALSLPGGAVAGLNEGDMAQALGLETQVLSGTPAEQAALGWRPLPGSPGREREFWVAQLPKSEVEQAAAAVRRLGGRLAGIVHPAGVPRRLSPEATSGRWRRVEFWQDASAVVDDLGEAGLVARVGRGAPPRGRADALPAECLIASSGPAAMAQPALKSFRLDDDDVLHAWLAAWADVLAATPSAVPVVRLPVRELTLGRRAALCAGFLVLIAVACGSHAWAQLMKRDEARAESARLMEPIQRFEKRKSVVNELEAKAKDLRVRANLRPTGLAPGLPGRVLEALAARCPDGVVVESLEIAWDASTVRGIALDASLIERFAGDLSRDLATEGRRAVPRSKRLQTEGPSSGFYAFEIHLVAGVALPTNGKSP